LKKRPVFRGSRSTSNKDVFLRLLCVYIVPIAIIAEPITDGTTLPSGRR